LTFTSISVAKPGSGQPLEEAGGVEEVFAGFGAGCGEGGG